MPVSIALEDIPDRMIAEWNIYDAEGRPSMEAISPNDVLPFLADEYTIQEIAESFQCPTVAVIHVIACIPDFIAWKETIPSVESNGAKKLPTVDFDQDMRDNP